MKKPLIILTGPTAVGKTKLSISLAKAVNGAVIHDPGQLFAKMEEFRPEQIISLSKTGVSVEDVILKIYQREKE